MECGHCVQVIAVTSGKGGVGKTTVAVNLALALADLGRRVVLVDGDLGLANIDVLLGIVPKYTLADLLEGRCDLSDVMVAGPAGVRIVPAASGIQAIANLSPAQSVGLIHAFSGIACSLDVLIIDTASGIGKSVLNFAQAAQEVLLVVCDEPTSVANTYALIKVLSREYGASRFQVLANMEHGNQNGRRLFEKLTKITNQFLDVSLHYVGAIPYDGSVRKSVQAQNPVYKSFPRSEITKAFQRVALKVDAWPLPVNPKGGVSFFIEQLICNSTNKTS